MFLYAAWPQPFANQLMPSCSHTTTDDGKRRRTLRNVSAVGGGAAKSALARILVNLFSAGYLDGSLLGANDSSAPGPRSVRRHIHQAVHDHSAARTPYGPVVHTK